LLKWVNQCFWFKLWSAQRNKINNIFLNFSIFEMCLLKIWPLARRAKNMGTYFKKKPYF
jgi:hypothetical protein